MMNFLTLEYPLTKTFRWRWFAPAALLGAFVVLSLLTLINSRSNHPSLQRIKARLTNLFRQFL
jgi:hypothetical protein